MLFPSRAVVGRTAQALRKRGLVCGGCAPTYLTGSPSCPASRGIPRIHLSPFTIMTAQRSAAIVPSGNREHDPEIKDMASYVHNFKIDSDLAVRRLAVQRLRC